MMPKKCYIVICTLAGNDQNAVDNFVFTSREKAEEFQKKWFAERCKEVGYTDADIEESWEEAYHKGIIRDCEDEFWSELVTGSLMED